jgi:hypothetical protein
MKTSSKILLSGVLFVFFSSFGLLVYLNANTLDFNSDVFYAKGEPVEQVRNVKGFTEVSTSESIDVYITQAKEFAVKVIADDDIIDRLITKVEGDELKIYFEGNVKNVSKKEVHISMPIIEELNSSSGAALKTMDVISGEGLEANVSSGAHMKIYIDYNEFESSASSGAHMSVKGEVKEGEFEASSGASINAENLNLDEADVDVSSGANVKIGVVKELSVDASSGGGVYYKGEPVMRDIDLSSGGSVKRSK